ncbi:hypothetical protein [Alkaliphilus transvaalensis]|uniref:hypothetical protein n=1 Tax=Alkaliphilus transvaalensis TaxID=114628 RepID=UPI00047D97B0|nr:hypothetical protein [Alkaliphilus transvaalensis]
MKLIESIASYTGESYRNIQNVINEDIKKMIGDVIKSPQLAYDIDENLMHELIEMDIFKKHEGVFSPNTAIFLEEDIEMITEPVLVIGSELADVIKESGKELESYSPNIKNFIGSIIGAGQGLHSVMKDAGVASNWQTKTGKYEKSKIDFNEECEAYLRFGEDFQIKRIHRGNQYTSVVIGAGQNNYISNIFSLNSMNPNNSKNTFYISLANYLTDTLPLLVSGKIKDDSLMNLAKASNIDVEDKDIIINYNDSIKYQSIITKITKACTSYFFDSNNIDVVIKLLQSTIVGKQGAPIENMMMNFWRYLRKATAIKLYDNGFLTDSIPSNGSITVFYENKIKYF